MDILYINRRGIYLGMLLSIYGIRPANRPDVIRRTVDAGRKKRSKMAYFRYILHASLYCSDYKF